MRRALQEEFPWARVLRKLEKHYEAGGWRVPFLNVAARDPYQILVSTVLSQRTRDEVTYVVAENLFKHYPTTEAMAKARIADIDSVIRRVGFHKAKARAIKELSKILIDEHGGKVPRSTEVLVSLPMVGRKTAGCVLIYGYGLQAIPVDTHVHRISNRLGAVKTKTPEKTEFALMESVPHDLWKFVNPVLVQHGQNICKPISPLCAKCPITSDCAYFAALGSSAAR